MIEVARSRDVERREFLLRLLAGLGVPRDDREDLAHQALLKFLTHGYGQLALDARQEKALLARIGYSTRIDHLRRRHPSGDLDADNLEERSAPGPSVQTVSELTERAGLEAEDLALLEMRFGEGLSCPSIAKRLDLHVNTIRRRLERLLARLREAARPRAHHFGISRSSLP